MYITQTKKGKSPSFEQFIAWNPILQLTCKITHSSLTAGWSTECLFFPFMKAYVCYNISWIHYFPPSVLYSKWKLKQWNHLLSLTTPDLSRGLGCVTLRIPFQPQCSVMPLSMLLNACLSSYIRTLTFFTVIQQNKTWTWNYMHTNNSV